MLLNHFTATMFVAVNSTTIHELKRHNMIPEKFLNSRP